MKYVGARYMPKFTGPYDATRIYEALSVVDNGSGTSYVANKPVPAGTPLTDTEYWAVYGSTSGAIINLQNQIDNLTDFVTPEMYGAAGDGITDDSAAISSAIATGKCVLCDATYRITNQIDISDAIICGSGTFLLDMLNDYVLILRDDSIIEGINFVGSGTHAVDGVQITKRPHLSDCNFENFKTALTISDAYTGYAEKCSFKDSTTGVNFKNLDWGGNTAATSFMFDSCQFVTSDSGITSESADNVRNLVIKNCVFEYIYVAAIDMYDTIGVIDSCWFEHINTTGSVAVKGTNCFFTTIMNRFINTVTTKFDLNQNSWNNVDRGYTSVDQKSIDTRILKLTDKYTQSDSGNRIYIDGDDGNINVNLGSTNLGKLPYTPSSNLKISCVSFNTYQSTPVFKARDTGFTAQKLSTGKYYINFNRLIDNCTMFVTAESHVNTPADINNVSASDIVTAHAYGINTNSIANFKAWKQADGVVIMVTDASGNLIDAHIDLMVVEEITV